MPDMQSSTWNKGPIALEITMEEYADGAEKYYAQSLNTFQNILNGGDRFA